MKKSKIASVVISIFLLLTFTVSCATPSTTTTTSASQTLYDPITGDIIEVPKNLQDDPEFQSYSKILQTVLTGSYYTQLIEYLEKKYPISNIPGHVPTPTYLTFKDNYCDNIPYGFLDEQGYDIDKIKQADDSACMSEIYILDDEPNTLYINCAVLNKSNIDYYDVYLLKYDLTEQEKIDLNRLFCIKHTSTQVAMYQAPFFVQELSYQKQAEVVKVGYMEAKTFLALRKYGNADNLTEKSGLYIDKELNEIINTTQGQMPYGESILTVETYCIATPSQQERIETVDNNDPLGRKFEVHYVNVDLVTYHPSHFQNFSNQVKGSIFTNAEIAMNIKNVKSNSTDVTTIVNINGNNVVKCNDSLYFNRETIKVDNSNLTPKSATFYDVNTCFLFDGTKDNAGIFSLSHVIDKYNWLYDELN